MWRQPPGDERREEHRVAEIRRDRGHKRVRHAGLELEALGDPEHVVHDVAMLDADALRPPGRAAGVDDVGQVLGPHRGLDRRVFGLRPIELIQINGLGTVGGKP
jgi:hypothetical protein